jgi:actin-like ATPase involved in cell morphogenesis
MYRLGIDLGTTYSAAAVERAGAVTMVPLGNRSAVIPSAVALGDAGMQIGEAASARSATDTKRVAREFKRRIGDPTMLLGDRAAHELNGILCAGIVRAVEGREGESPMELVLSHPAGWTTAKRQLFVDGITSVAEVAWPPIRTVSEPEAAATHYASTERVEPGAVVAVYDLGGGTFDAAVLRRNDDGAGFEMIGQPEGIDRLGGIDFDAAIVSYVNRHLNGALDRLDIDDPSVSAALARLRYDCTEAKQALSTDTDVRIQVLVPGVPQTEVRITRSEFESMIQPALSETVGALRRALRSASVTPQEVAAVLLIGGSSRIPLVARLVGAELGRPVAVDAHPKHGVSLGAAMSVDEALSNDGSGGAPDPVVLSALRPLGPTPTSGDRTDAEHIDAGPTSRRRRAKVAVAVAAVLVVGIGAFAITRPRTGSGDEGTTTTRLVASSATATTNPNATNPNATNPNATNPNATNPNATNPNTAATVGTATTAPAGRVAPIPAVVPASLPPTCQSAATPFACLTAIGVDEAQNLIVPFVVTGYTPLIGPSPNRHVHFYFNVGRMATDPLNAGTNGPQPGDWVQWDAPNPMGPGGLQRGYTVSDARDVKATQLCIAVADHQHAVVPRSGNCLPLPAAVIAP